MAPPWRPPAPLVAPPSLSVAPDPVATRGGHVPAWLPERLAARRAVIDVLPALHREVLGTAVRTMHEGHERRPPACPTPTYERVRPPPCLIRSARAWGPSPDQTMSQTARRCNVECSR